MRPSDLIASAGKLLGKGKKGPPKRSEIKRALSTVCYAMFHALCWNCADALVGSTGKLRSQSAWSQVRLASQVRVNSSIQQLCSMEDLRDRVTQVCSLRKKI